MKKLLVNAPTGAQQVIAVDEGGGYFDLARVVWDEREDGELPDITLGGMVRSGAALVFSQARMDQHTEATKPAVPSEVTMRQARLALLGAGKLAAVDAAINGLPEPQRSAARIEWDYSSTVRREQPLVLGLAPALGLTSGQLDALFIAAAAL